MIVSSGLLLGLLHEAHILVDTFDGRRGGRHPHFGGIGKELVRELLDRFRHGRREEQGLPLLRNQLHDLPQRVDEAEIKHLIGLVEDEDLDLAQREVPLLDQIDQPSRRRHDDVDAAFERTALLADRHATEDGRN